MFIPRCSYTHSEGISSCTSPLSSARAVAELELTPCSLQTNIFGEWNLVIRSQPPREAGRPKSLPNPGSTGSFPEERSLLLQRHPFTPRPRSSAACQGFPVPELAAQGCQCPSSWWSVGCSMSESFKLWLTVSTDSRQAPSPQPLLTSRPRPFRSPFLSSLQGAHRGFAVLLHTHMQTSPRAGLTESRPADLAPGSLCPGLCFPTRDVPTSGT